MCVDIVTTADTYMAKKKVLRDCKPCNSMVEYLPEIKEM